jgi:hypothetical protein
MTQTLSDTTPEMRARRRAEYLAGLIWHVGTFVIINVFLWVLDALGAGGIDWAFWVTGMWGIGLAFHVLAYLVDGRGLEERKTQEYLIDRRKTL